MKIDVSMTLAESVDAYPLFAREFERRGLDSIAAVEGDSLPGWSERFADERKDIVDRDDLGLLVRNFYRDAAMDDVIGPVFEAAHVNWNAHVETLIDFWAWQLLGEPGYVGHPLRAHEPVNARTPLSHAMYERWVELFCDTVDASFEGPRSEAAKVRGRKMAAAMERLLAGVSASGTEPIEPMWRRTTAREASRRFAVSDTSTRVGT